MRADARRNRARVLEAAEAVFAASGTAASTEEIARRAGVGIGTVFRHFPTKEALLEAILVDKLVALVVGAAGAAAHAGPDGDVRARTLRVVFDGLGPPAPAASRERAERS